MDDVELNLNKNGSGYFYINEGEHKIAEMTIDVSGNELTVYHTEVLPKAEGRGLAKKLLTSMADYARKSDLKVIALCPYVHAQFSLHPDEYSDIWKNKKT
ncbi:N-acetyltransferase [Ginsengibacter hankyongi]|uniref:N-acetyltransferase n=1 Tax=Ginsengibacter hankyongi TaxID=2607284 RepID=A0A5J5IN61_9BACT|nr:GNAT family N-acetyltransferase [Ginsengibacter hankyongi]KAA9040942.1 N-acetyltransferase [Ginsengibacter hankyongi]